MTTDKLTLKERETLDFIDKFICENGYSPSQAEIMTGLESTSKFGVQDVLDRLTEKGYIRVKRCTSRSIVVVREVVNA